MIKTIGKGILIVMVIGIIAIGGLSIAAELFSTTTFTITDVKVIAVNGEPINE